MNGGLKLIVHSGFSVNFFPVFLSTSSFNPAIIHYTGPSKPWKFQNYNPYADLWYYFQSKTIWKNLPKTHEFHGFKLFKWHIKHFLEIMHLRHKRVDEYINMSEVNQKILKLYNDVPSLVGYTSVLLLVYKFSVSVKTIGLIFSLIYFSFLYGV